MKQVWLHSRPSGGLFYTQTELFRLDARKFVFKKIISEYLCHRLQLPGTETMHSAWKQAILIAV